MTSSENDNYNSNTGNSDDKDSVTSGNGFSGGIPIYQSILMNFLDNDAPVLDENASVQNRAQFTNLVHLFSELIRHDVFSHDAYMCTLISRGDLLTGTGNSLNHQNQNSSLGMTGGHNNGGMMNSRSGSVLNKMSSPNNHPSLDDDMFAGLDFKQPKMEEYDDNVDDDLDKILQHIKVEQNSMDAPDSPKDHHDNQG